MKKSAVSLILFLLISLVGNLAEAKRFSSMIFEDQMDQFAKDVQLNLGHPPTQAQLDLYVLILATTMPQPKTEHWKRTKGTEGY